MRLTWHLELSRWKPSFVVFRLRCWWHGTVCGRRRITPLRSFRQFRK